MKAHKKRMRVLRGLTIGACAVGLAASSAAGARPLPADPPASLVQPPTTVHPHGRPAVPVGHGTGIYILPASHTTDVQSSQFRGSGQYVLPTSHTTDVQSSPHAQAPVQPPVAVTREIRTVTDHGDRTLALVLAAAALGIALCGTGYATVRLANLQRRMAGSS